MPTKYGIISVSWKQDFDSNETHVETWTRAFVKFDCAWFPVQKQSVVLLVIAN